jgi:hypothetical protein
MTKPSVPSVAPQRPLRIGSRPQTHRWVDQLGSPSRRAGVSSQRRKGPRRRRSRQPTRLLRSSTTRPSASPVAPQRPLHLVDRSDSLASLIATSAGASPSVTPPLARPLISSLATLHRQARRRVSQSSAHTSLVDQSNPLASLIAIQIFSICLDQSTSLASPLTSRQLTLHLQSLQVLPMRMAPCPHLASSRLAGSAPLLQP